MTANFDPSATLNSVIPLVKLLLRPVNAPEPRVVREAGIVMTPFNPGFAKKASSPIVVIPSLKVMEEIPEEKKAWRSIDSRVDGKVTSPRSVLEKAPTPMDFNPSLKVAPWRLEK